VVIFEGDIVSIADYVTESSFGVNVQIQHWLNRLQYAFIISAIGGIYVDQQFIRYYDQKNNTDRRGISVLNDINIVSDLVSAFKRDGKSVWNNLIKETFKKIISINASPTGQQALCELIRTPSEDILKTLERIEELDADLNISPGNGRIFKAYKDRLYKLPVTGQLTSNLWEILISYVFPEFNLQIIPQVSKAIVAPICPTLNTQIGSADFKTLSLEDTISTNYYETIIKPVSGVAVVNYYENVTGGPSGRTGILQCYVSKIYEENKTGSIYVVDPPSWIIGSDLLSTPVAFVEGSLLPGSPAVASSPRIDNSTSFNPVNDYLEAYAHTLYTQKKLEERSFSLVSRLRFDIAPGSMVLAESPTRIPERDKVGRVRTVTVQISSTKQTASTVFDIDHVKTREDEKSNDFKVDKPPLYNKGFYGAPLVEEFKDL
jgi:hypothetical protein